mmetsp:Transcript_32566/g.92349  ORF Transcript_32566/g.92349 Transcript_32566/m.92349 type:complete len:328 (-) Transcript_32566:313-1296(-)|eukprot:CAMPEP_0117663620 /NCGR_PEP_ID=MMETSP0804-20121206/8724_1 /TAXON_ID=1074897 /ORGANISM="Tetraselmis astigmatica, Strain CCMP880" /LENGTH=327 /DNA_ID=CAMNT_0005470679 /DNA_START=538 /DNA_END=1521 /DNA_ORIENTATION=-
MGATESNPRSPIRPRGQAGSRAGGSSAAGGSGFATGGPSSGFYAEPPPPPLWQHTSSVSAMEKAKKSREEGNARFQKQKFAAAIESYTEAIVNAPHWEVPYINRALCHKKRGEWADVQQDATKALELNSSAMKAHYLLGLSQLEQNQDLEGAADHLTKALHLARENKDSMKDDIWRVLARAKFTAWKSAAAERRKKVDKLRARLERLVNSEQAAIAMGDDAAADDLREDIKTMESMFARCRKDDETGDIPPAYVCQLTMDIFRDPVMTPSGLSYERSALMEHLQKVGLFDPVTRQPMGPGQVVPNSGLRSATHQYLDDHPWAWEECM